MPAAELDALFARAAAAVDAGDLPAAQALYREILAIVPQQAQALHHLGVLVANAGDVPAGMAMLRQSLRHAPQDRYALWNLGTMALATRRYDEALGCFNRVLALAPGDISQMSSRAAALAGLDRHEEALEACETVLSQAPGQARAMVGRAGALAGLGRDDDALAAYRATVALHPDDAEARFGLALALLATGAWAEGWAEYEWRERANPRQNPRRFAMPAWQPGDPLAGRRILVHAEQGFGDTLQFARYLPLLAGRGAAVVAEVDRALVGLLGRMGGAVCPLGTAAGPFDAHLPFGSLPLMFATTIETVPAAPYLHADPARVARWQQRLGPRTGLRVGLVWSGNAFTGRKRHLALSALAPLLARPVTFVALQVDISAADRATLEATANLHSFAGEIADFGDTAALAETMDLVISVDTATGHLAGALGRPLWLLLAHAPDWRWLRNRDDSPWYPTARLFRQTQAGNWAAVVARVGAALDGLI